MESSFWIQVTSLQTMKLPRKLLLYIPLQLSSSYTDTMKVNRPAKLTVTAVGLEYYWSSFSVRLLASQLIVYCCYWESQTTQWSE